MTDTSDSDGIEFDVPTEAQLRYFVPPRPESRSPSPPESSSPTPGPSRPRANSPTPGPSRPRADSPTPGPSRLRADSPDSIGQLHESSEDTSDSDFFDPELHRWSYKKHKRRRVEYKNMQFSERRPSESSDSDGEDYVYSPPSANDNTFVFQNRTFSVRLQQIGHSRHSQFNYSDHLYNLSIQNKKSKQFKIRSLFRVLYNSLSTAIDNIKEKYDTNTYENQIYGTIIQSGILNGLNSGGYSMATPTVRIVSHMMNMLENYLQSHENLTLHNSFKIQFKFLVNPM